MNTQRTFNSQIDRYYFDLYHCTSSNGWAQIDTTYDAPFYGAWANAFRREIVTYTEGDISITQCDNDAEFVTAIRNMHVFHIEDKSWKGIDAMSRADIEHKFTNLGLADLLH